MKAETLTKLLELKKDWESYNLDQKKEEILKFSLDNQEIDLYVEAADFFFETFTLIQYLKKLKSYL
jgi:hypothetical protein